MWNVERKSQQSGAAAALKAEQAGHAMYQGMPLPTAKGIAPRNSEMGSIDSKAIIIVSRMGLYSNR